MLILKLSLVKVLTITLSVVVLTGATLFFTVEDIRSGVMSTLRGSVKDTVAILTPTEIIEEDPTDPSITSEEESPAGVVIEDQKEDTVFIHILDTEGTSVLVVEGNKTLLIDGGMLTDTEKIQRYLNSLGIGRLTYLVATNYHETAIEGLPKILSYYPVDYLIVSENISTDKKGENLTSYFSEKSLTANILSQKVTYKLETVTFELIPTHEGGSLLVLLSDEDNKILLSGDITRVDEEALTVLPENIDLYSISSRKQTYLFPKGVLEKVNPKTLVISGSSDKKEVTKELQKVQSVVFQNESCGTILVSSNGSRVSLNCEKN